MTHDLEEKYLPLEKKVEFLSINSFYFRLKEFFPKGHNPAMGVEIPTMLIKDTGSDFLTQHLQFASNGTLQAEKMHRMYIGIQNSPRFYCSVTLRILHYKISKDLIGYKIEDFHLSLYEITNYHFLKCLHYW